MIPFVAAIAGRKLYKLPAPQNDNDRPNWDGRDQCARKDSNLRPRPYQGRALAS